MLRWLPQAPLALSVGLLPLGLGLGLLFPVITVMAQRVSPVQHLGIATATPIMLRNLGGAAGVALLATLFARLMTEELTATSALDHRDAVTAAWGHGLQSVFAWTGGVAFLALLVCGWLAPTRPSALPEKDAVHPAT